MIRAKVFALDKDESGRTALVAEAVGENPRAGVLGGLFRDRLLVDVLDRAAALPATSCAVIVVEGSTDEAYLRLAAERSGRENLMADIAIVQAGAGVSGSHAGGAALVVMQALIAKATSHLPIAALFDDDAAGKDGQRTLRDIGRKTGDWKKNQSLFSYAAVLDPGASFAFEAEDLWPNELFESFIAESGEPNVLKRKELRPRTVGGWQYDLAPSAKGRFVEFLQDHAKPQQCDAWIDLISRIRKGLGIPAASAGGDGRVPTVIEAVETAEEAREADKPKGDERRGALWPLPGGRKDWKNTLDEMVAYLYRHGTVSINEAAHWLERRHPRVRSRRLAVDYWLVPGAMGLLRRSGGKLTITSAGSEYAASTAAESLGQLILANVWGAREVVDYLGANEASTDELLEMLRQLGASWQTDAQVVYRLRWLELCGLVELSLGSWRSVSAAESTNDRQL